MARGTTLGNCLAMLKGELGFSLTSGVAVASDQELYTLLDNKQKWLSSEYDWPFLKQQGDVAVAAADRYLTVPTNINFERPVEVVTLWTTSWSPVFFGIGAQEYNALSSGDGGVPVYNLNPVARWDWKPGDPSKFEIWPIPTQVQLVRFTGQAPLTSLKTAGAFDPAKTLDLDDLLVVLYAAAEKAAVMKRQNAQAILAMAESRFNRIRASYSHRSMPIVLGGGLDQPYKRIVPIVAVAH